MRHFTPRQLKEYLEQADSPPQLVDVRESWEYRTCSIMGSEHIPMSRIASSLDLLDPNREIVVICHHGIRSRQVGYYLESMGFDNLINLAGGINAWAREVDPDMPVY